MKNNNFNEMSIEEISNLLKEEKQKYLRMKFNHSVSPLANPIELRIQRRNIARALTALNKK
jgi:large subunit ribosomal protein L29